MCKMSFVIFVDVIAGQPKRGSRLFFTTARKSQNLSKVRSETCAVYYGFYIPDARKLHVEISMDFEQLLCTAVPLS